MKNRERLSGNEYDLLFSMNVGYDRYGCILENIEDSYYYDNKGYRCFGSATGPKCSKCIQEWLNKEENAMTVNGRWYTETEAQAYIITLEHKNAALEDKHLSECRQISEYDHELRQAKRLLKAAIEDNKRVLRENFGDICQFCKHYSNSEAQCCKPHNGSGSWCCENAEWRYADEALKLIGGTDND